MLDRHVEAVVVVDTDGVVKGVVTDRDLTLSQRNLRLAAVRVPRLNGRWVAPCDAVDAACAVAGTMTAAEVMEHRLTTAELYEPIGAVVDRMVRREADYAIVLRNADVVGVLGRRDLLRLVAGQVRSQSASVSTNGRVHNPPAHVALTSGGLPAFGWLAQAWR
jgi:signal-transduction protein with cAMP-binding, CBS, and nucleotidyltransferase domain